MAKQPNASHQDTSIRRALTLEHLEENYPASEWIRAYTDGSAEEAVRNGGAGIFVQYPNRMEEQHQLPTGILSTNYKAEVVAITKAAQLLTEHPAQNIVILTDALSVLESLENNQDKHLNELTTALSILCTASTVILQWIPSHCGLYGNDVADALAKAGSQKDQPNTPTSNQEQKTIIKSSLKKKWEEAHPNFKKDDPYHLLTRKEQVVIFRLRTKHNRLRHHLHSKFKIGPTDECICGHGPQTTWHVLQECCLLQEARKRFWPTPLEESQKLYGCHSDLQRTAAFIFDVQLSI